MSTTVSPDAPAIPPRARTIAYVTALVTGAVGTAVVTVTAAVAPEQSETVAAIVGAATTAVLTIVGGLGVAYRPTRTS